MRREAKFQKKVIDVLEGIPELWFTKIQQLAKRGDPDILMGYKGKLIAWELKDTGKKATKLQAHTLEKITNAGCIARVVTPENYAEMLKELYEMD